MMIRPPADHPGAPDCEAVRAQAFAACDDELTAGEVAAIDAHLAGCEPCRAGVLADATFHRVVRMAVSLDDAPQSLHDRILLSLTTRTTENAPA
jgi:mycothiol system anti-sigma-R factor